MIARLSAAEQAASSVIIQQWCSAPYSEQNVIKTIICTMELYHFLAHFKVVESSTLKTMTRFFYYCHDSKDVNEKH